MAESAERDVIFRLKVEPGRGAIESADKFGKALEQSQLKVYEATDKRRQTSLDLATRLSASAIDVERKATEEISALIQSRIELREREAKLASQAGASAAGRAATSEQRPAGSTASPLAKQLREEEKLREKAAREFERNLQKEQAARDRASKEAARKFEKSINDQIRLRDKEAREAARLLREQEKEEERIHKRHRQRQRSIAAQNRKERLAEAKEAAEVVRASEREVARATGRMAAAGSNLEEGLSSAGDALIQIGTGFAEIGILSEQNSEKMLRSLVLVRGINDVLSGSIDAYVRIGRVVEGYRQSLEAVKAVQTAINAQQAIGAAAAARGATGAAAGAAGGAASGLAGGAAGGAAMTGLQKITVLIGGAISKIGSVASVAAVPLAKVAAILGGIASAGDVIYTLATTGSIGPRQGSMRESAANAAGSVYGGAAGFAASMMSDSMLEFSAGTFGDAFSETELSNREMTKREEADATRRRQEEQRREGLGIRLGTIAGEENARLAPFMSAVEMANGQDKFAAIDQAQQEIGQSRQTIQSLDTADDVEIQAQKSQALYELEQRSADLAKQRQQEEINILQTKKEQATVAINASREELSNAKLTLDQTKQKLEANKQSLLSLEVRFAQMKPKEQKEVLDISLKAQRGETLTRKEREIGLSNTGGRVREIIEQQAVEEARRLGVDKVGGASIRKQIQDDEAAVKRQEAIVKRVETQIKVQEEYVVSLEENVENVRNLVLAEVKRAMAARDRRDRDSAAAQNQANSRGLRIGLADG